MTSNDLPHNPARTHPTIGTLAASPDKGKALTTYREGVPETQAIQPITERTVWGVYVDEIRLGPVTGMRLERVGEEMDARAAEFVAAWIYGVPSDAVSLRRER